VHDHGHRGGRRSHRNDEIRGGQGSDTGLAGEDGSDVVKGQQDDDQVCGNDQSDDLYGGQGADKIGGDLSGSNCAPLSSVSEGGNDLLKSRDHVSGNDTVDGGDNTDTCRIDAGDQVDNCEL